MNKDKNKRLEEEREKLNRLVDEALADGTPISETDEIMKQCRIIKRLSGEDEGKILQNAQTDEKQQG